MLIKDAFQILEIEKTDDKRAIKGAYRRLLPLYNPEEDEEKFLMLRQAYEVAMDYAQNKVEEELPEPEEKIEAGELPEVYPEEDTEKALSKEEGVIHTLLSRMDELYGEKDQRNNPEKWAALLENDIFLSLDYGKRAKKEIVKKLSDKYLLKTNTLKLVFERLQLYENGFSLWECAPKEYILYFMSKIRDISDYTDFLYDEIECENLQIACQDLMGYFMGEEEVSDSNPQHRIAELFGLEAGAPLLWQIERLVERHPVSIYWRLWEISLYGQAEMDAEAKEQKLGELNKSLLNIFVENYLKDSQFLHWQAEFVDSMYVYKEEQSVLSFSRFGEFMLGLGYFMRKREKAELLDRREDRLLLLSYLDTQMAKHAERRDDALALWRSARDGAGQILAVEPEHPSALYIRMMSAAELHDFQMVEECYEKALKIMPENVGIYIYMATAYDFADRRKESGFIFEEAKRHSTEDYRLQIRYLRFREQFDFVDGYNLEEPLAICHQMLKEMSYYAVTGDLLADGYYTMGRLILADSRYDNAGEYLSIALEIRRKPEYLFVAGLDCMKKNRDIKTAIALLEEVYQSREIWGDSECNNPMFAEHSEKDITEYLDICDSTDLYNLCTKLGLCYELLGKTGEETGAYRKAAEYYREALSIKPDMVKVGSAIVKVMEVLLESGEMELTEVEEFWEALDEQNKSLYSLQWLKALIAYKKGDEKAAIAIASAVAKGKADKSLESDWIYFAKYLLAKIYWGQKKSTFAIKYLRAALDGFGVARRSRIPDNRYKIRQICLDAAEWFAEMGMEKEAQVAVQDLKRFQ